MNKYFSCIHFYLHKFKNNKSVYEKNKKIENQFFSLGQSRLVLLLSIFKLTINEINFKFVMEKEKEIFEFIFISLYK